jgi:hypothetical protein
MTLLSEASLEFARRHITSFYDSDFFPTSQDFEAVWARWDDVRKYLTSTGKLPVAQPFVLPAPKASFGYRMVHQLDALTAVVYTALAHQVAGAVEAARLDPSVACSYRIQTDADSFFRSGNGYETFTDRSIELAVEHSHVLVLDISAFYNSVYLHRVANAIKVADGSLASVAEGIERFLLALNNKASQGLPIGPAASIVFSEAVCSDIDQFIKNLGFVHTRYVDDLRIFAQSEDALASLLESVVEYLYEPHRLQIAWSKTSIVTSAEFKAKYIEDPERAEKQKLIEVIGSYNDYPGLEEDLTNVDDLVKRYLSEKDPDAEDAEEQPPDSEQDTLSRIADLLSIDFSKLEANHRRRVRGELFEALLSRALESPSLDVGLSRRVLRRSRILRSSAVYKKVLNSVAPLGAVAPDAFLYLDSLMSQSRCIEHLDSLRALTKNALIQRHRYLKHWTDWFLGGHTCTALDDEIGPYLLRTASKENQARAAVTGKNFAWIRANKLSLEQLGGRDRRAVIWAARILPADERKPWLSAVSPASKLEEWVKDYVVNLP